jgi:hypothetical protein
MQNSITNYRSNSEYTFSLCKDNSLHQAKQHISNAKIEHLYLPQTNGEVSDSIMQNWTKQAIECFEISSDCTKCSLRNGNYSFICQMPKIVKALVKTYGPPEQSV